MPYVYSTITNNTIYNAHTKPVAGGRPQEIKRVLIKGGNGIAGKHLITPIGVATHVNDEDADFLRNNDAFKRHIEKGFIQIRNDDVDPEVAVASGMQAKDDAAPKTPEDYADAPDDIHTEDGRKAFARPTEGSSRTITQRIADKMKG